MKAVRRLGTIIQSIFCAQSGASNRLTVWKWSGESRYRGAFPPVFENFCRAFSLGPTDRPWVSEDGSFQKKKPNGEVLSERILSSNIDTIRNLKSKRKNYFNFDILKFVLGS